MDSNRSATEHEKITVLSGGSYLIDQAMHNEILRRNQNRNMDSDRSAIDEGKYEKNIVLSGGSYLIDQAMHDDILRRNHNRETMRRTLGGHFDCSEAKRLREIEKQRIKEEFIMGGILRRRELEMEVMEELMMERNKYPLVDFQSPLLQPYNLDSIFRYRNYFPFNESLSSMGSHGFDRSLLAMNRVEEGGPSSRVNVVETGEKTSLFNRVEGTKDREKSVEELPFQRRPGVSSDVVSKPITNPKSGPNVATTQTKPVSSDGVGTKRKLETPVVHKGNETTAKKAHKRCWNCSLCQVSANSERVFEDHLNGKLHNANEKAVLQGKSPQLLNKSRTFKKPNSRN